MPYVLGIDIGTTSTVAATARPHDDPSPQVLGLGTRGAAVPSVLYLDAGGQVVVGEAAERRVVLHPERVVREVKRRVGDTVPVSVGDVSVTPQDLFATQARWVVDRAEEREGEPPAAVALAVPATWGSYRAGLVRDALAGVGLADVTLVSEPLAAARHYLAQQRVADGAAVAVYDFGGGTFDAAVLRKTGPHGCTILGAPEGLERLGGADLDELVLAHVSSAVGDHLTGLDPTAPGVLAALARLRRECTEAKEALSADAETTVPVLLPGLQTQVRLVRAELEELIAAAVEETAAALAAALDAAKVAPVELEAILLVGGSSRIPLVAEVLSARFGRPIAVDTDPQASVALGTARAAAEVLTATTAEVATEAATGDGVAGTGGRPAVVGGRPALAASAATPDEAPARLTAAGSAFAPETAPPRRRHVTGARVAAVSAAVLGITMLSSLAGEAPEGIDAGRSLLSSVVSEVRDSLRPDPPAAAAVEKESAATTAEVPMATDASVFAGRRAQGQAITTGATGADTSESPAVGTAGKDGATTPGERAAKGTSSPSPKPAGTGAGTTGTKAPTKDPTTSAPTSPAPTSPAPTSPGTGTPTTGPTTPPATQEPTTAPTTPPATQEPTTAPTTPPATQEPAPPASTAEPAGEATTTTSSSTGAPGAEGTSTPTAGGG